MANNVLSIFNLARLVILAVISKSYDKNNDITAGLLPSDIDRRISFIMSKHGNEFSNIIDKETFGKYEDKWFMAFYQALREAAGELRVVFIYDEDTSALKIYCSTAKAEQIVNSFNSSSLKDEIDHFIALLTDSNLFNRYDEPKMGM